MHLLSQQLIFYKHSITTENSMLKSPNSILNLFIFLQFFSIFNIYFEGMLLGTWKSLLSFSFSMDFLKFCQYEISFSLTFLSLKFLTT